MMSSPALTRAQSVSEIITDYNGFWKSSTSAINSVKPANSHNLLGFSYNGTRFSTGVDDAKLTTNGLTFTAGLYKALPISRITGTGTSQTKIGLGEMYDGVHAGASNPAPENNMVKYMTDGIRGLDLGTGVANLPVGDLYLPISSMQAASIGDNIPDLLITQIADPSTSSLDSYQFLDINGNTVGNKVDIVLNNLSVIGNWTADFYDMNTTPMTLSSGFANTDRPLRLWAADLSTFGINASNVGSIAYFRIRLNGNSDVAFVAYNEKSYTVPATLPVQLNYFRAKATTPQQVDLNWQSSSEVMSDYFVIENSLDGVHYSVVDSVVAKGTASTYAYTHHTTATGKVYYRLKQLDKNGTFDYSQIATVTLGTGNTPAVTVYPNPATQTITIKSSTALSGNYEIYNTHGAMLNKVVANGNMQQAIGVQNLPAGMYYLVWNDGATRHTEPFVKK